MLLSAGLRASLGDLGLFRTLAALPPGGGGGNNGAGNPAGSAAHTGGAGGGGSGSVRECEIEPADGDVINPVPPGDGRAALEAAAAAAGLDPVYAAPELLGGAGCEEHPTAGRLLSSAADMYR